MVYASIKAGEISNKMEAVSVWMTRLRECYFSLCSPFSEDFLLTDIKLVSIQMYCMWSKTDIMIN